MLKKNFQLTKARPERPIPNLTRLTHIPATNNMPTRDWLKELPTNFLKIRQFTRSLLKPKLTKARPERPISNLTWLTHIPATNNLPTRDWLKELPTNFLRIKLTRSLLNPVKIGGLLNELSALQLKCSIQCLLPS